MKKLSQSALVAAGLLAGGLTVTSANAADLGGNCCADLEERIAELEATTARKGNRKVSLTVSGWVAEQVMAWDDGIDEDVYVGGIGTTLASHVKFTGQATISPGWTAGYVLHIEGNSADALAWNQNNPEGGAGLGLINSYWFVKSDHLGKVSLGRQSHASDNAAILVDGSGSLVPANFVAFDYGPFNVRRGDGTNAGTWGTYFGCSDCNGVPSNSVRYDSPTFGGFSFSTSWGGDDFWDVAARYAGEHGGFKIAATAAYSVTSPNENSAFVVQEEDSEFWQVGAYAQHVATGLFVYGAYTNMDVDNALNSEAENFYVKAGLRQRWTPLGHTVLYGEYQNGQNDNINVGLEDREGDLWGLGVVQEIDAAAMSVWLSYRHVEGDSNDALNSDLEDFDYVKFGALINF